MRQRALLQTKLALLPCVVTALDNGLGRVPIRGVTSWCMQGQCGWDRCWDAQYRSLADAMVEEGMKASGYTYLHVDDCWVGGRNATTGELYPDAQRFPLGMASLAEYVHNKGLLFGIYTDVTQNPCIHGQYDHERGHVPGSYGFYEADAATFARWGVDYVKADFCNPKLPNGTMIRAEEAYPAFSRALNATGRSMYFLACYDHWLNKSSGGALPGTSEPWTWLHPWANAYRLSTDHHDNWAEVRKQIDLSSNSAEFSVPGSFGDWDALITGGQGCAPKPHAPPATTVRTHNGGGPSPCRGPGAVDCGPAGGGLPGARCPNMTEAEYRTAFSIWVIGASPLMIDADIRNMSVFQRETLLHEGMLAIHSDPLGRGGSRVGACMEGRDCEVWVKPLVGNHSAVAMLNAADEPRVVGFSYSLLGYSASSKLLVRDVWAAGEASAHAGSFVSAAAVPAHGTLVLLVSEQPL